MLTRAVIALSVGWGVLCLGLAVWDASAGGESPGSSISGGLLAVVVLPFILPWLLRSVSRWVVGAPPSGVPRGASPRRPRSAIAEWPRS